MLRGILCIQSESDGSLSHCTKSWGFPIFHFFHPPVFLPNNMFINFFYLEPTPVPRLGGGKYCAGLSTGNVCFDRGARYSSRLFRFYEWRCWHSPLNRCARGTMYRKNKVTLYDKRKKRNHLQIQYSLNIPQFPSL